MVVGLNTHLTPGVFLGVLVIAQNIEYRISNIEPQNYEGVTSTFDIPCSIFCGSEKVLTKPIVTMATVSSV